VGGGGPIDGIGRAATGGVVEIPLATAANVRRADFVADGAREGVGPEDTRRTARRRARSHWTTGRADAPVGDRLEHHERQVAVLLDTSTPGPAHLKPGLPIWPTSDIASAREWSGQARVVTTGEWGTEDGSEPAGKRWIDVRDLRKQCSRGRVESADEFSFIKHADQRGGQRSRHVAGKQVGTLRVAGGMPQAQTRQSEDLAA
jgi:hypothetical protein